MLREKEGLCITQYPSLLQHRSAPVLPPAVPVTFAWRDELEKMTKVALSKAMGQPLQSSRPGTSQLGERPAHLKSFDDRQVRTDGFSGFPVT